MSSDKKLKVGVIGVGVLGRHHARLYKENPNAEVVGIFDVVEKNAIAVAQEFGFKAFSSMEELIDSCDALSIAVPATQHHETALAVLSRKKHLLIEKPIAAKIEEAKDIVNLAIKNNLVLGVGHVERFNPAMDYLEQRTANTKFIEAHRLAKYPPQRPGMHPRGTEVGVVLDLMIHDLDLILIMMNCEIEKFDAVGIPVMSETEDIASVRIKFVNGAVANLTASRVSMEPMRRIRVFQTDCYLSLDYASHNGHIIKKNQLGIVKKEVNLSEKNALEEELGNFIDCVNKTIETGKVVQPKVTGEHGLKALELAVKITEEINRYNNHYGFKFK